MPHGGTPILLRIHLHLSSALPHFYALDQGPLVQLGGSHPFLGLQTSVLGVSLSTLHESWSTALGRLTLLTPQTHYTKEPQVLLTQQARLTPSRNL